MSPFLGQDGHRGKQPSDSVEENQDTDGGNHPGCKPHRHCPSIKRKEHLEGRSSKQQTNLDLLRVAFQTQIAACHGDDKAKECQQTDCR